MGKKKAKGSDVQVRTSFGIPKSSRFELTVTFGCPAPAVAPEAPVTKLVFPLFNQSRVTVPMPEGGGPGSRWGGSTQARDPHVATVRLLLQDIEREFDDVLDNEPETPERAAKLRDLETKRTALADSIGAC